MSKKSRKKHNKKLHQPTTPLPTLTDIQNKLLGLLTIKDFNGARALLSSTTQLPDTFKCEQQFQIRLAEFKHHLRSEKLTLASDILITINAHGLSDTQNAQLRTAYLQLIDTLNITNAKQYTKVIKAQIPNLEAAIQAQLSQAIEDKLHALETEKQQPILDSLAAFKFTTARQQLTAIQRSQQTYQPLANAIEKQQSAYTLSIMQLLRQKKPAEAYKKLNAAELPPSLQKELHQRCIDSFKENIINRRFNLQLSNIDEAYKEIHNAPLHKDEKDRFINDLKKEIALVVSNEAAHTPEKTVAALDKTYQLIQTIKHLAEPHKKHLLNATYRAIGQQVEGYIAINQIPSAIELMDIWYERVSDRHHQKQQQALADALMPKIRSAIQHNNLEQLKLYFQYAKALDHPLADQLLVATLEQPIEHAIQCGDYARATSLCELASNIGTGTVDAWQNSIHERHIINLLQNRAFTQAFQLISNLNVNHDGVATDQLMLLTQVVGTLYNAQDISMEKRLDSAQLDPHPMVYPILRHLFLVDSIGDLNALYDFQAAQILVNSAPNALRQPLQAHLDTFCGHHLDQIISTLERGDFEAFSDMKSGFTWRSHDLKHLQTEYDKGAEDWINIHIDSQNYQAAMHLIFSLNWPEEKKETASNQVINAQTILLEQCEKAIQTLDTSAIGFIYHAVNCALFTESDIDLKEQLLQGVMLLEIVKPYLAQINAALQDGNTESIRSLIKIFNNEQEKTQQSIYNLPIEILSISLSIIEQVTPLIQAHKFAEAQQILDRIELAPIFQTALQSYVTQLIDKTKAYSSSVRENILHSLRTGVIDTATLRNHLEPLALDDVTEIPQLTHETAKELEIIIQVASDLQSKLNNHGAEAAFLFLSSKTVPTDFRQALEHIIQVQAAKDIEARLITNPETAEAQIKSLPLSPVIKQSLFGALKFQHARNQSKDAFIRPCHHILVTVKKAETLKMLEADASSNGTDEDYVVLTLPPEVQAKIDLASQRFKKATLTHCTPEQQRLINEIYEHNSQLKPKETLASRTNDATLFQPTVPHEATPPATGLLGLGWTSLGL